MPAPTLLRVEPVLPVRDVGRAAAFYERLGFRLAWRDDRYAVLSRDGVVLHLQWHDPAEWEAAVDRPMLRFPVSDVAALFDSLRASGAYHEGTAVRRTPWRTEEFAFYDPDRNGLTFYRDVD